MDRSFERFKVQVPDDGVARDFASAPTVDAITAL